MSEIGHRGSLLELAIVHLMRVAEREIQLFRERFAHSASESSTVDFWPGSFKSGRDVHTMARRTPSSNRGSAGCGPHVPRRPFGRAGSVEPDGRRPARARLVLLPWISRSRDGQWTHLRSEADGGRASDAAAGYCRARDEPQERPHG